MCIRDRDIGTAKLRFQDYPINKMIYVVGNEQNYHFQVLSILLDKLGFEWGNIIFIDFMDLAYEEIKEYHALHAYVEEHYQEGKTNYLFVDEVQMCPKFELAINRCV